MSCAWLGPVEVLMISKDIAFASGRLNDLLKEEGITYPEGYRDDREKAREESSYVDMWVDEIEEARNERDRAKGAEQARNARDTAKDKKKEDGSRG